ncbi:hypothetical protein QR52_15940 [Bordetella pertussis]|uniref:Two-component sensor kinase N-terminal domain protein n=2 Tax=Bordetella pertussis TaxID=520 RepID=A0AAI9IZB3_BORPT|nr:Two-component sensor kinase N-terminal region [Bordetella pertussis 137]ALX22507.1 hypothetical protein UN82_15805 [Bordetella pertussis]ETA64806.1 two-component sensor kinase N-terminal domain protein [Bordetella pertussis CHLA-11]ETH01256.1 two-component sensor kinase N-terminal domain protein [Bordetella pertussis 2250905]ETH02631.1 two-component sensor kinase N-terminal domain protein [Bordetella pertussis 2356847]ETH06896.1 two-component sensor kinase N-terminal domain protein [Bordete
MLPGVVVLLVIDSWNDYRTLAAITNEAYDSALLEPARVLESSLEFAADGTLQVATPLYAQVMLESKGGTAKRRIYAICSALSVNLADSEYGPPGPAEVICAAASPRSQRLKTTSRSSGRMRG